jgi:hypothetical protein
MVELRKGEKTTERSQSELVNQMGARLELLLCEGKTADKTTHAAYSENMTN